MFRRHFMITVSIIIVALLLGCASAPLTRIDKMKEYFKGNRVDLNTRDYPGDITHKMNVGVNLKVVAGNENYITAESSDIEEIENLKPYEEINVKLGQDMIWQDMISYFTASVHNEALKTGNFVINPKSEQLGDLPHVYDLEITVRELGTESKIKKEINPEAVKSGFKHNVKVANVNGQNISVPTGGKMTGTKLNYLSKFVDCNTDVVFDVTLKEADSVLYNQSFSKNFVPGSVNHQTDFEYRQIIEYLAKQLSFGIDESAYIIVSAVNAEVDKIPDLKNYSQLTKSMIGEMRMKAGINLEHPMNVYKEGCSKIYTIFGDIFWGEFFGIQEGNYLVTYDKVLIKIAEDKLLKVEDTDGNDITEETIKKVRPSSIIIGLDEKLIEIL